MNEYLNLVYEGKNKWWRFVLATLLILFAWQIIGALPVILLILWTLLDNDPSTFLTPEGDFHGISINISFIAMMLASVAFLAGIYLAVRFIHQRRLISLITPRGFIDWKRLLQGFAVWFGLCAICGVIEAFLYPGRYVFSLRIQTFIPFFFLALMLIPVQTSTEELFFRGYLLQGLGIKLRNPYVLSFFSGLIFMLPHLLNPEAKLNYFLMGISYFIIGAILAYITLIDGRLELALGLHAANNLYTALFANATITVMPTPSLFTVMELDTVYSTIATIISCFLFILLFFGPLRRGIAKADK